jgi:hypothetical protein
LLSLLSLLSSLWELHSATMDGTMLTNDDPTVDGYHLSVGKGFLDKTDSLLVLIGLSVSGN